MQKAYRPVEMARWREIRGIALNDSPLHYPVQPSRGHRMLLAAQNEGSDVGAFVHAALKGVWADELNLEDSDTMKRLADGSGLDGERLWNLSEDPALIEKELALTEEALARNVFGAPFFFYKDEPFWGQDRLDLLERALLTR
jgi:2-hydroxychromene-2-carboxylate isomerase